MSICEVFVIWSTIIFLPSRFFLFLAPSSESRPPHTIRSILSPRGRKMNMNAKEGPRRHHLVANKICDRG